MKNNYIPNIARITSNEDASLKAISLLLHGFPIRVNHRELIFLDKIYERKEVNNIPDVVLSNITISELPFIIPNLSNEEVNFIAESYRYNIDKKDNLMLVTTVINYLRDELSEMNGKIISFTDFQDVFTHKKTSLEVPMSLEVNEKLKLSFSADTLKIPGKKIERIDSIWKFNIPEGKAGFIWGTGIDLNSAITPPDFDFHDNDKKQEHTTLTY